MRIALDYTAGISQKAGVGYYVRNLVDAMLRQDIRNKYLLLSCKNPTGEYSFPATNNVQTRTISIPDRYWFRWRLPFYSWYFSGTIDIYHGLNFALPALKGKQCKIVTIYDLSYLEYAQFASPKTVAYLSKVVPVALSEADVIVTLTQETARMLNKCYQTPLAKIAVVPGAAGEHFQRVVDPIQLEETRRKFDIEQPFILSVGTLEPRKNHIGLIKALYKAQDTHGKITLAIAGGEGWLYEETRNMVSKLHLEQQVRFLGRVNDRDLLALYSLADVFAYPSFCEGFGIPLLEAMASGTPVLTSNVSCIPEVVGDAALLVNPHDVDAIAEAIVRIMSDASLREHLRQKGYARVQNYTWARAGRMMLSIYHGLYTGKINSSVGNVLAASNC